MLAIDCAPRVTPEMLCKDTTIEELYNERRLLINRLLRCRPTDITNNNLQTQQVGTSVAKGDQYDSSIDINANY